MEFQIRPTAEADLPAIVGIRNEAIATTLALWTDEPGDLAERTAWLRDHEAAGLPVLSAVADKEVLGFGCLSSFRGLPGYAATAEDSIYVASAARGRGVGSALLAALIDAAAHRNLHTVIAAIEAGNGASLSMHRRAGFTSVGTLRQVGRKRGQWLDLTYLQLLV